VIVFRQQSRQAQPQQASRATRAASHSSDPLPQAGEARKNQLLYQMIHILKFFLIEKIFFNDFAKYKLILQ
jgi:hypothetical protein